MDPQGPSAALGLNSVDQGQDDQHGCIRDDRAADGNGDSLVLGDIQPAHDGIGDQGVGRKHTRCKQTRKKPVSQEKVAYRKSDEQRQRKRECTKQDTLVLVTVKFIRVKFKTGEKHNVKQPNRRKQDNRLIPRDQIKPLWTDDHAGDN